MNDGIADRIRTGVYSLRGNRPRPLDDSDVLVATVGFEPTTYRLSSDCSTPELHGHV